MPALRKRTDRYVASVIDDEVVLIDLSGGLIMTMDGTARAIWDAIDGTRDAVAIAALLAERFDGDGAIIEREVRSFTAELVAKGLLAS